MTTTPWGQSQDQTTWAPGIIAYGTASHGGVWLSLERRHQLPIWAKLPDRQQDLTWWEEDCDWVVPFLVFLPAIRQHARLHPEAWLSQHLAEMQASAERIATAWRPNFLAAWRTSLALAFNQPCLFGGSTQESL